jgi:DNA-binding NarL/FixJ family response regulator
MTTSAIRVLCADDTDIAAEGMQRILESEPHIQVIGQVTQQASVIQAVQEFQPDVLLLDLKWGGVYEAGCDLIRQIRVILPHVRIVAITVYDHLVASAKKAGADDVVTKDISRDDLIARIKIVYAHAKGQEYRVGLLELLDAHFDEGELRTFCFALGVDYGDLPDVGKANKARELIRYFERRGRIAELVTKGKQLRPDIPWEEIP